MSAEIIEFNKKQETRTKEKCSFCGKTNKIVMISMDDQEKETGKYICEVCVKKMGKLINENN